MMAEPTSGPWHWEIRNYNSGRISTVLAGGQVPILTIVDAACCRRPSDADANLVAAAPELLEACKAMLATWGSDDEDAIIAAKKAAIAAVAKATGPS